MYGVEGEPFLERNQNSPYLRFLQWMYDAPTLLTVPLFRMYRVATMSCYPCRNISNFLFRYLLQVTWMKTWVIKQWHRWGATLFRQQEQFSPHFMIWTGMESGWLFGTYFFDGPINQHACLDKLQKCFLSQLENLDIKDDPCFKQDREPAYYALPVREYLSLAFWGH